MVASGREKKQKNENLREEEAELSSKRSPPMREGDIHGKRDFGQKIDEQRRTIKKD